MSAVIDIIIIACLGWGAYKGFKSGFIIQSFTVFSVALAIWGGFAFAGHLEPILKNYFNIDEIACSIVSFVIVFLMILLILYVSGHIITKIVHAAALGMINRLAGAAFGIFANALILSVIILMFGRINDKKQFVANETLTQTYLYEPIGKVAPAVLPDSIFEKLFNK